MKRLLLPISLVVSLSIMAQLSSPAEMQVASAGTLSVTVTTASTGGKYAPENVMAIWVVNSTGVFVKTLMEYGTSEKAYLTNWKTATSSTYNIVDAISGATRTSHGVRTCTWNGTNVSKNVVDDGTYTLKMELTDKSSTGNVGSFTFNKSNVVQTLTPTTVPSFSGITINWIPTNTAVDNTEEDKLFRIYPNSAKSDIYVSGFGISRIDILDIKGRVVLSSETQQIKLTSLANGVYFCKIHNDQADVVKKFVKQ